MPDSNPQPVPNGAATPPLKKARQGRSPAFPFISLGKALERAETFRVAEGGRPKHFAPTTAVCVAWGIGPKTGTAQQTIAALGHYGLFEFEGSGEQRTARLTDTAFDILFDKQPISAERDGLIRLAALKPPIHAELWQKWQAALPSDVTLETYLIRDRGFSENGARDLIAEYKETISFAKLGQSTTIPEEEIDLTAHLEVEVGDWVQVEIDGVLQLSKAARVRAVQERDEQIWVFVDGSLTGIPMDNVTVSEKGASGGKSASLIPPTLEEINHSLSPNARKEVFALDEGDVILTFPENLSPESYEDLEGYFALFLKKAKRRAESLKAMREAEIERIKAEQQDH
jgi:hypothetical protein